MQNKLTEEDVRKRAEELSFPSSVVEYFQARLLFFFVKKIVHVYIRAYHYMYTHKHHLRCLFICLFDRTVA